MAQAHRTIPEGEKAGQAERARAVSLSLFFPVCLLLLFITACSSEKRTFPLRKGVWRGELILVDSIGRIVPFNFDVKKNNDSVSFIIRNAEERIKIDEISFRNDSVFFRMPVFDSEFLCRLTGDSLMEGVWLNHARKEKNTIPFIAWAGEERRFDCPKWPEEDNFPFEGRWKCLFSPHQPDSFYAIGIFKRKGLVVTGTFMTETGDYRFLEGCVFGKYMLLSAFDGSRALAFHAEIMEDGTLWGDFYSGIHHEQTWIAWKDSLFRLRHPDSLTFLKAGFSGIAFSFPNLDNKKISFSDERFNNKVVLLQIMGSWCPNCADETEFLTELYNTYKDEGLEIIALCFEKTDDFETAKRNVLRLKNKYHAGYEFLITNFQPKEAKSALPMLNHIMSFPTTIFIDRNGAVRKIHTGYSGPATGKEYEKFKNETKRLLKEMLKHSV